MVVGFLTLLRFLNSKLNGFQPCTGVSLDNIGFVPPVYFCYPFLFGVCKNPWEVDTKFTFYNSYHKENGISLEYPLQNLYYIENVWREAAWNVFIVHGYNSNMDTAGQLFKKIKDMYLRRLGEQVNVVLVDWKYGARIDYQAAVANIQVVGKQIAFLIEQMKKNVKLKFNLNKTVFIGHSLGAHIMGIAGKTIYNKTNEKVAKIVGLDPAGPCMLNSSEHISCHNAEVVEILHTNSGTFGTTRQCGHIDFYPNSGVNQPKCKRKYLPDVVEDICDHSRVTELLTVDHYSEGICQPIAYKCENYSSFEKGFCASCENNGCRPFGLSIQTDANEKILNAEVADKGYYLKTSGESPYCVHHFQIVAQCKQSEDCEDITIYFIAGTKKLFSAKMTKMKDNIYTALITRNSRKNRYPIKPTLATFWPVTYSRKFHQIEVKYMSNMNHGFRNKFYSRFCRHISQVFFKLC